MLRSSGRIRSAVIVAVAFSGILASIAAPFPSPALAQTGGYVGGRFLTAEEFVDQAYRDVLGRPADAEGLAFWADLMRSGTPPHDLLAVLVDSPEFAGIVAPVARLYYAVFDRSPDLEGLQYWIDQRRAGASLEVIADSFLASREFAALSNAANDTEVVEAVYGRVLGRVPDPAGLAYWVGLVSSGQLSVSGFVVEVSESIEHQTRRNPVVTTTVVYLGLLQRLPDPVGVEYWSGLVADGLGLEVFIAAVMAGAEYLNRFPVQIPPPEVPSPEVTVLASGFAIPWDAVGLPDGSVLVSERGGAFKLINANQSVSSVNADLSDLFVSGETGLMGLALDQAFATNRRFYSCQGHMNPGEIQVIAWTLSGDGTQATRVGDPLVAFPLVTSGHAGCQLSIDADGNLIVGTGDSRKGSQPQDLSSLAGKVLRVNATDGSAVAGNPFIASPNPQTRLIMSFGHRNVQGVAIHPETGDIWTVEHGPDRDDEVNRIVPGGNYGWNPVPCADEPCYNQEVPMTDLVEFPDAISAVYSTGAPTLALSGADFLSSPRWGAWQNSLAVAALKNSTLRVFFVSPEGAYLDSQIVIDGTYGRLRGVSSAPDGSLLVTTSNGSNDQVLRVSPD